MICIIQFLPAAQPQRLGHKLVSRWGSCWEGDVCYLSYWNFVGKVTFVSIFVGVLVGKVTFVLFLEKKTP